MAQQTINIGTVANDGTGDTLRVGGDKINDNFTELYAADAALGTAAALDIDIDDTLAANSDSLIPTQQAVKAYVDGSVGSSITELDDVPDVNAPTPANGDVLTWDSTPGEWVNAAPAGAGAFVLDDATDVNAPTPSDGDVLTFDSGSGDWVPAAPSGGSATACPAIRSSNLVKYASGASYSHPLPTGAAAGDFCVILHSGGFPIATITSPAKAAWDTYQHTASNWGGTVFTRVLTASDITAGSVTVTPSGSFDAVCGAVCFTGEAKLRFPFAEQGTRVAAIHSPGAGATSSTQETAYASADDCIITFLSNRGSSTNTSDHGTQLQTTTNANGSGALYAHESPSAGGQVANLAYSTAGTGRYEIMLVVRGPN